ncbi:hypothetical protein KSP39_PZI012978 [Platanthera zijinensis]|uniref:F-box domain-containing protein n=1 Tax=Platanthera zijinensis TaxID=2320716 RepID=A0AAP0G413_9ASPA
MDAGEGGRSKEEDTSKACILPTDCVQEILTRVESSVLSSCRRVCRSWRRLSYQPTFEAIRAERTATAPGFLLGTLNHNVSHSFHDPHSFSISSPLLPCRPQDLRVEAALPPGGLLFLKEVNFVSKFRAPSYYITRLGSPHHRRIPNPKIRSRASWSGIVCGGDGNSSDEFKIVRIYESMQNQRSKNRVCACEVFDSVTNKWRCSADLPYLKLYKNGGAVIKQTTFWMCQYAYMDRSCSTFTIFAFDVNAEQGRIITGPDEAVDLSHWPWKWEMIACEDMLYLVQILEKEMEVWMMTETAGEPPGWERKGRVSFRRLKNHAFAFEDGISDHQVALLETLYREFWCVINKSLPEEFHPFYVQTYIKKLFFFFFIDFQ